MATKEELLTQSQEALMDFFKLSKMLFGDEAPYDINELDADNPFYQKALDICNEMDVDWDTMSHADSNSIMLNMLGDCFQAIRPSDKYFPVLSISFKKE